MAFRSVGNINDQFLAMANNVHEICIQLKDMIRISSRYKLSCAWPGENCNNQLKEMKPSLEIDKNQWSLIPTDIMIPLEKLKGGLNQTVLACLSLNEIHLTYHPDWQAPPSKIEHPDKRKHSSKRTPKPNSSTHPAPNASNSTALDSPLLLLTLPTRLPWITPLLLLTLLTPMPQIATLLLLTLPT
ncbi:hypothetical protein H4Q26_004108 [Puccinia striiformis f. sp. tritici PST-130]|nr:hypothetical protein H4Q26_004108 [Puccinia striiformis f. sp. tritici PST-130]